MADEIGTFEGTLAKLAADNAPAQRAPVSKNPAPSVGMPVAPIPTPAVLAPVPTLPPALVIPPAVAADRVRVAALIAVTAKGAEAEAECREAIRNGISLDDYMGTVAARLILDAIRASRGGSE